MIIHYCKRSFNDYSLLLSSSAELESSDFSLTLHLKTTNFTYVLFVTGVRRLLSSEPCLLFFFFFLYCSDLLFFFQVSSHGVNRCLSLLVRFFGIYVGEANEIASAVLSSIRIWRREYIMNTTCIVIGGGSIVKRQFSGEMSQIWRR